METKTCTNCLKQLPIDNFYKDNRNGKYRTQCKDCCKNYDKTYYVDHKIEKKLYARQPKVKEYRRAYNQRPEIKIKRRERDKQENNILRRREKDKTYYNKRKDNEKFKLEQSMCVIISSVLSGRTKESSLLFERCGYTANELRKYIELQFTSEMSWNNYGKYWEVDHIIPRRKFNYISILDNDFKQCWALSNLRPLTISENRQRRRK